jgi:hypothetical protein
LKEDGILLYRGKVYVPNSMELKNIVLRELHNVSYDGHQGYQKSITIARSQYFWPGMKKEVANYIARCLVFHKVKTKHMHLAGMPQPFTIIEWKKEVVRIYFITKMSRTMKQHDSIMVVVEKLTKEAHFIPMKTKSKATSIAKIYMKEVSRIHGVPKKIISYIDSKFTSKFWQGLFKGFGKNLNLSTIYHQESDGKT